MNRNRVSLFILHVGVRYAYLVFRAAWTLPWTNAENAKKYFKKSYGGPNVGNSYPTEIRREIYVWKLPSLSGAYEIRIFIRNYVDRNLPIMLWHPGILYSLCCTYGASKFGKLCFFRTCKLQVAISTTKYMSIPIPSCKVSMHVRDQHGKEKTSVLLFITWFVL